MNFVAVIILADYAEKANNLTFTFDRLDEVTTFIACWAWLFSAMMLVVRLLYNTL